MKKILAISLFLLSTSVLAQDPQIDLDKMISDKSFVFMSTASFGDKSLKYYNPFERFYDTYTAPTFNYDGKIKASGSEERMLLVEQRPPLADKLKKNKVSEIPVMYINKEGALFHESILAPTPLDFVGKDRADLNSPLKLVNYTVKKTRKGKWIINFKIDGQRSVQMFVSQDGSADMTLSHGINNVQRTHYKGSIQALASL